MKVIDVHRHLWQKIWFPESAFRQFATVGSRKRLPFVDPETLMPRVRDWVDRMCDPDATKIIKEMDDLGTDVAVLHCLDWGSFKEDAPTPIEEINKFLCDVAKKYPGRVHSLIGVDPRRPGGLSLFEKGVTQWGALGLNFFPPFGFYPNDESICYPYYEKCVELGVPLAIHMGYQHWPGVRNKYAMPIYMDDVGVDFPDLVVIMNHTGMDTRASTWLWEQCVVIAESKVNFYLEVADWPKQAVRVFDDTAELVRKLKIMRDAVGAQRILFGTDQPATARGDDEASRKFVDFFKDLPSEAKKYGVDFSQEEVELIMHGNAERIFGV